MGDGPASAEGATISARTNIRVFYVLLPRIGQLVDVVGEIGGVSSYEGKNGRTERVHPVKAEEVDAPAGSRAAPLKRSPIGADNREVHPIKAETMSPRPDDSAYILPAQI